MANSVSSYVPNRKIAAAGSVGVPLAIVLAWAISLSGVEMPAEVSTALGAVISTIIGYLVPEKASKADGG